MVLKKTSWLFLFVFYSTLFGGCTISKKIPVSTVEGVGASSSARQSVSSVAKKKGVVIKSSSLTRLGIRLISSRIVEDVNSRYLYSELEIVNPTVYRTKIFIEGWMLDNTYKRYPLFVELNEKKVKRIVEIDIPVRSTVNIVYLAEGDPTFTLGKRTIGVLALKDQSGLTMNLTISR